MVVLNLGLLRARDLLESDITHGQAGTDGTVPSQNDSGLFAEVASTNLTTTSQKSSNPATISETHIIPTTTGNNNSFQEWELRLNNNAESFNRTVTAAISKVATEELQRIVTIELTQD